MAIDPQIASSGNPITPFDLGGIEKQAEAIQQARLQAQQRIAAAKDQAAAITALKQTSGDYEAAAKLLDPVSPTAASMVRDKLRADQKEAEDIATKHLTSFEKRAQLMGSILNLVPEGDDQHLQAANQAILGLFDDPAEKSRIAALLPTTATADELQRGQGIALSVKDAYTQRQDAIKLIAEGKAETGLAGLFSHAQSPEDWQETQQFAAKSHIPTALIQSFGQFSPQAVQAAAGRTLTPEQMTAQSGQLPGGGGPTLAAKTAAANQAMADARLKVEQGNLAVAQHREARESASASAAATEIKPGTPDFKVAQDLAYGRMTPAFFRTLQAYNRDANKKAALYAKAAELNPDFNEADFERGFKFISNVKIGQQLASLDNVQSGLADLLKASDAASRSGVTVLNQFAVRPFKTAIGDKSYSNFKTAVTAFADELSGALGYGSATDMSREMGFNMTNLDLSPENFKAAMTDIVMPFVDRKRASILKQGSVYGKSDNNSAVTGGGAAEKRMLQFGNQSFEVVKQPDGTWKSASGAVYDDAGKRIK